MEYSSSPLHRRRHRRLGVVVDVVFVIVFVGRAAAKVKARGRAMVGGATAVAKAQYWR